MAGDAASTTTGPMQLSESSFADDDAKGSTVQEETQSVEYGLQSQLSDKTSCATCHEPLLHDVLDNTSNPSSRRDVSQATRPTEANKDETDLATQLMNHKAMESACNDEEPTAQEVKQDATTNSAHEELLPSGLSWPTAVAAAGEFSPVADATNCASPPQPRVSINDKTYATVLPRSPSCSSAADYFDMLQTPPPTPRNDFPGGRENTEIPTPKLTAENDEDVTCDLCRVSLCCCTGPHDLHVRLPCRGPTDANTAAVSDCYAGAHRDRYCTQ